MGLIPAFLRTRPPTHMFPHLFFIKNKQTKTFSLFSLPQVPKSKFNQRNGKNAETKESSQAGQDYSLATKQNQGLLVPPQGLQILEPHP